MSIIIALFLLGLHPAKAQSDFFELNVGCGFGNAFPTFNTAKFQYKNTEYQFDSGRTYPYFEFGMIFNKYLGQDKQTKTKNPIYLRTGFLASFNQARTADYRNYSEETVSIPILLSAYGRRHPSGSRWILSVGDAVSSPVFKKFETAQKNDNYA